MKKIILTLLILSMSKAAKCFTDTLDVSPADTIQVSWDGVDGVGYYDGVDVIALGDTLHQASHLFHPWGAYPEEGYARFLFPASDLCLYLPWVVAYNDSGISDTTFAETLVRSTDLTSGVVTITPAATVKDSTETQASDGSWLNAFFQAFVSVWTWIRKMIQQWF